MSISQRNLTLSSIMTLSSVRSLYILKFGSDFCLQVDQAVSKMRKLLKIELLQFAFVIGISALPWPLIYQGIITIFFTLRFLYHPFCFVYLLSWRKTDAIKNYVMKHRMSGGKRFELFEYYFAEIDSIIGSCMDQNEYVITQLKIANMDKYFLFVVLIDTAAMFIVSIFEFSYFRNLL